MTLHSSIVTLCILALGAPALAQPRAVPEDLQSDNVLAPKGPSGWDLGLNVGANGAFLQNENIPGQPNGITLQLGLILNGKANLVVDQHRWDNILTLQEGQTYTPQLAGFLRSSDTLEVSSTYKYAFEVLPWLGPFARLWMRTHLLRGEDVRAEDVTIVRNLNDGTQVVQTKANNERYLLTHPFEPLLLRQSAGFFAQPIKSDVITFDAKAGVGFQEQITQGGFVLNDDASTPELDYTQLTDNVQGGVELGASAQGKVSDNVTWWVGAALFYPFFVTNNPTNLDGADLLDVDFTAKLSVKLVKWLSVDYAASVRRQPLLVTDWQVQNQVLLTASFELPIPPDPAPEQPEEKCECPPPAPEEQPEEQPAEPAGEQPAEPSANEPAPEESAAEPTDA